MAGESARQEYERRRRRDARGRRRALPFVAAIVVVTGVAGSIAAERAFPGHGTTLGVLLAIVVGLKLAVELAPRSSTTAFAKGADGEVAVAKVLDGIADHGWTALHDRLLPRGPQLDHLVVGPGGVLTVDAKRYSGKLIARRDGTIRIAGRNQSALLRQANKQSTAITDHLARHGVAGASSTPVLCFVGTQLPKRHLVIGDVHIVTRRGLKRLLTSAPPVLDEATVARVARLLDDTLAPAVRASTRTDPPATTAGI